MNKIILSIILIGAFITIYPVAFLITGAFMSPGEITYKLLPVIEDSVDGYATWSFLPFIPSIRSLITVLLEQPEFFCAFWNSVKIVVGVLAGQMLFGIPAAWGFARYEFRGKKVIFFLYITMMLLPFQVVMLSEYLVLRSFNILDSLWAVIVPGAFSTFSVFIMYNFFKHIPENIVEAARLDGASEWQIFFKIGLPLGKTGIVAVLILQALEFWSVVEQPMIFFESRDLWTLSLYLPEINLENIGQAFVASVITLIPTFLIFILCKDDLEKGIVASAVKE